MFRKIDARCDQFEEAWKASIENNSAPPKVEEFLGDGTEFDERVRLALACIDLDYRKLAGIDAEATVYESLNVNAREIMEFRNQLAASEKTRQEDATIPPRPSDDKATIAPSENTQKHSPNAVDAKRSDEAAGKKLGNYEIIEEIARGGMGVVYKAKQTNLNRLCALKMILSGQFAGQEELQRFYVEAEAAANLQHPGIVPVFEVGEIEGQHFYSMGFVDGQSLSDKITDGPMRPEDAAELTRQISEAIAFAHEKNVIHRDLKPANVLIDKDGTPKVTDFGLAKKTAGESELTATGQILGTPSYMPPEQAAGALDQVDEQSDLYSLGAILYCLLSGRPPFQAANPLDILLQVIDDEPIAPTQLNPTIPRDLETICLKCMAKDKSKRYSSVQDLVEELNRFKNGESILARPATRAEKMVRWCKRKPAQALSIGLAVLFLLVLSIAGPWIAIQQSRIAEQQTRFATEQKELRVEADTARSNEEKARTAATKAKELTDKKVYARTISLAYEEWKSNDVSRAEALLDQTDPEMRSWEWDFTKQLCNSEQQSLMGLQNVASDVAMLNDGIHVAAAEVASPNCAVLVWDWKTGAVIKKHSVTGLAFSTDGQKFAALVKHRTSSSANATETIGIFETLTGKKLLEITPHNQMVWHASFSPDGTKLATCGNDSRVRTWDLETGDRLADIMEVGRRRTHPIFWSEDGQWIGWKLGQGGIRIHQASDGNRILSIFDPMFRGDTNKIAIHRGKGVIASGGFGSINLFDIESKKKTGTIYGHKTSVTEIQFMDDGNRLVTSGGDMTVRVWDVESLQELAIYRGHKTGYLFGVSALSVSSDQQWIVSSGYDRNTKIWSVESLLNPEEATTKTGINLPSKNQEANYLYAGSRSLFSVAISPDGMMAALGGADQKVFVLDTQSGQLKQTFDKHQGNIGAVAFHPEKSWVASGSGGINDRDGGDIFVWDVETGEIKHEFKIKGPVAGLKFAVDGKKLIATSGSQKVAIGEIATFDLDAGKLESSNQINSVFSMDVSPDGSKIAVVTVAGIIMYDLANEKFLWNKREASSPASSVAFSPDSKHLVVGKRTAQTGVYDAKTGERIWHKIGHLGQVTGVAYFDNGTRIVSVGNDKTTKIWNAETGDILLSFRDDGFEKFGVVTHPDQKTIYVYGEAPYVTVRGHQRETEDNTSTEFTTLFSDDFERSDLGEDWIIPYGEWKINDGVLEGKLDNVATIPNYVASSVLAKQFVPSYAEIEYDVWSEVPMFFQTTFSDTDSRNAISALYIGVPVPFVNSGRQGAAVSIWSNWTNDFNHATDKGFRFEKNQKYRVKTICDGQTLKVFCDGQYITERNIPDGFTLTKFTLSGAFAPPGSKIFIDNVVVKVRNDQSSKDQLAAIAREYELYEQLASKTLVLAAIDRDDKLNEASKSLARNYAAYRVETAESRLAAFGKILIEGSAPKEIYLDIEKAVSNSSDFSEEFVRKYFLATCCIRLNKFEQAIAHAESSDKEFMKLKGSRNALAAAVLSVANFKLGRIKEAKQHLIALRELSRSHYWNQKSAITPSAAAVAASSWGDIVSQTIDKSIVESVMSPKKDETEILELTFAPQQDADLNNNAGPYFDTFTADAVITLGRTENPNQLDRKMKFKDWKACQQIWYRGAPSLHSTLIRDFVDVNVNGDQATLTAKYCFGLEKVWWRLHQLVKLRKTDSGWKIYERRDGIVQQFGRESIFEDGDWDQLDNKIDEIKKDLDTNKLKDRVDLSFLYRLANRHQEAYNLLDEISENEETLQGDPSEADYWQALSMCAWQLGNPNVMESANRKSLSINPDQPGPAYVAATATQLKLPAEFKDFGHQIKVKIPKHLTARNPRLAPLVGETLGFYTPDDKCCILINRAEWTAQELENFDKSFQDKVVSRFVVGYKAQSHRQRTFKFGKRNAFDFVLEANGTGIGIQPTTGGVGKGTILRIVGIKREKDIVFFSVCAFAHEFDSQNSMLEVMIQNATLDQ